jgi:hypothetical protein
MFIAAVWKGRDSHADKAKFSSLAHRFLGEGANIWFPTPAIALAQASASRTDFHGAPSCVATGAIFAIDDGGTFDRNQQALFSELYRSRGAQFVESINGQFACAIANAADGSLFIARDHIGIEPLYYSDNAELTVVSSFAPAVAAFNHQADSGFDETTPGAQYFLARRSEIPAGSLRGNYGWQISSYALLAPELCGSIAGRRKHYCGQVA